jgi:lipoprotein-releasing system permease protein
MYFSFAWRYFKAKKSTNAINVISWVSVTAIIVGTASLIIILSAFNGFESLVKSLYSSFYPDLRITAASGKVMTIDASQYKKIVSFPGIRAGTLVAEENALLTNGDIHTIIFIKGVDSGYQHVSGVPGKMIRGSFSLGDAEHPLAVLGVGIENAIGVLSDRAITPLTVYLPKKGQPDNADPLSSLGQGQILPSGSFAIQSEFDNKFVITNIDFLKSYLNYGAEEYTAFELMLDDISKEKEIQALLTNMLGKDYKVLNRFEQNQSLYSTIQLEKWVIYGIFSLILLVAAFNMIGALSMLVLEKKKDIQVLQAMGAEQGLIRKIFISEGLLLAMIGAGGGLVIALILYYLQINYKLVPLQGQSFLIDYYPVKILLPDILLVIATVFLIGILASWFPASRAAKQPFELRN